MDNDLLITRLTKDDLESAYGVFARTIPEAFKLEGLEYLEDVTGEIKHKKSMLVDSLENSNSNLFFLVAKIQGTVVGTISFGPCGDDVRNSCNYKLDTIGELGSIYVLPNYQDQGVGSALIFAMLKLLQGQGVEQFYLDSGFSHAQKRWLRKFGKPYKIIKDYWGSSDHMIWLCNVRDCIKDYE